MPERPRAPLLATAIAAAWGPVHIAASERGLAAVEMATTREAFEAGLAKRGRSPLRWVAPDASPGATPDPAPDGEAARHLAAVVVAIEAGLRGDPAASRLVAAIPVDLDDRPAWDRAVLGAVRAIPRGEVRSYGEIARAVDRPGAARAVGGAVGRNPIGYVIPCHRVVAGDGTLGGYGGGWWGDRDRLLDIKDALLAAEGVALPRSRPPARAAR